MIRSPYGRWWILFLAGWFGIAATLAERSPEEPAPEPVLNALQRGMLAEINELMQEGRLADADARLGTILERMPDFNQARQLHAAVLISLNRYEPAIAELEELLRRQPDDPRAMNNLAWMLATSTDLQFRDPARALQLAQDAVLLAPSDFHIWSTLAEAHRVNANFEQAVKAMMQAIDLAGRRGASAETRESYRRQFEVIREAAAIMSLIE
ncbi:MAG TPA: tetratricopeptide repeat protein [Kiritimatiellia bacterium]|nr:tetratricopeptide repeat protein [Kiritimatiellia bacterium]HMP32880.1 tetratricopeptide repeat protein [Kiritimatiellia bacterium]